MKKLTILAALTGAMALSAVAADFSGYIVDQNCAKNKAMLGNVQCAQSCIKRGAAAVLVTDDGKIYKIADQDKVKEDAGKKVTISGSLKEDTLSVDSIKAE
jgi:hypothetical protein